MGHTSFEINVIMHKQSLNITKMYMKVAYIPKAHTFPMGITVPADINPDTGEKSICPGQVRYTIRIN